MITIRENVDSGSDGTLGHINQTGEIYGYLLKNSKKELVGRVDYGEGVVYLIDDEGELAIGWIDDEGRVIASAGEDDYEIGYVDNNGNLYYYFGEEEADHVGLVSDMTDPVEGAAALLIFFDYDEEDFE